MKLILIISILFFSNVWTKESSQNSFTNRVSDFLPSSGALTRSQNLRILTDNNFNVDDYDSSSDNEASESYIPIMTLNFYGTWNETGLSNNDQQFSFFNNTYGSVEFTASENYTLGIDNNLAFRFYDGPYKNQKAVVVNFIYDNDTDFYPAISTFQNDSIIFSMYMYDDSDSEAQKTCEGSYKLVFLDSSTNQPYQKTSNDYQTVYANFWLNSTNCSVAVSGSVATNSYVKGSKSMNYAIMIVVICVAHLYGCIKLSRDIILNEAAGNRISLMTLGLFSGWDVFLCLFHLYNALTIDDFFPSFVIPAFCYFILVSIFETRLILLVWKARYYNQLAATNTLRRGLMVFYLKFYGFLSLFLLACYFVIPATWFFYATALFFVPQIVHSAMRGQRCKFNATFAICLGLVRIAVPLYVKVCPVSIYKLAPEPVFGYCYGGLVVAQILIMALQARFGCRFFVPGFLLPAKYNYYVSIKTALPEGEVEGCPICMDPLNQYPSNAKAGLLDSISQKHIKIMRTPCKHEFHEKCLKDWMDVKLECPFCRSTLPPIE